MTTTSGTIEGLKAAPAGAHRDFVDIILALEERMIKTDNARGRFRGSSTNGFSRRLSINRRVPNAPPTPYLSSSLITRFRLPVEAGSW